MKPSDASMKRAREWDKTKDRNWGRLSDAHMESLALLLDAVRNEALEEAAKSCIETTGYICELRTGAVPKEIPMRCVCADRIRALKVQP